MTTFMMHSNIYPTRCNVT